MTTGLPVLIGLTLGLVVLGLIEAKRHARRLRSIRVRIHVNGTRGKSSVVRLLAAALRQSGLCTCAKTTGTLARMILPDGREVPVFRPAGPNIIEHTRIVAAAAAHEAEALVVECMALNPFLQWLMEAKFVRATHGVVTNARADHLDVMGPAEVDVAKALAGMTPSGGKLFVGRTKHVQVFETAARDRGSQLIRIDDDDIAELKPSELAGFAYAEHPENIALALKVCSDLGIGREVALRGMRKATPDPGAMTEHELDFFGRQIMFVNGFAANDPESTEHIWRMMTARYADRAQRIAVFNCRADRPERSMQLARAFGSWPPADHVVLIGDGTYVFARAAARAGVDGTTLIFAEDRRVEEVFETIISRVDSSALVMGMGNIGGPGLPLVRYFRNRQLIRGE